MLHRHFGVTEGLLRWPQPLRVAAPWGQTALHDEERGFHVRCTLEKMKVKTTAVKTGGVPNGFEPFKAPLPEPARYQSSLRALPSGGWFYVALTSLIKERRKPERV